MLKLASRAMTLTTALNHGATLLAHLPTARRDAELLLLHANAVEGSAVCFWPAMSSPKGPVALFMPPARSSSSARKRSLSSPSYSFLGSARTSIRLLLGFSTHFVRQKL